MKKLLTFLCFAMLAFSNSYSQSVAQGWNEVNLDAVRNDNARPTVTARNLWHVSAAMYDAWAAYDLTAKTYFLGKNVDGFYTPFNGIEIPETESELEMAREEAISYAAYRLLYHRYTNVPEDNVAFVQGMIDDHMTSLGYEFDYTNTDYTNGNPAALGNYIAERIIEFGYQDGSNEQNNYANQYYEPLNSGTLVADMPGNPSLQYPNRWQRLLQTLDQNEETINPEFLSPEWGNVVPFSLTDEDKVTYERDENFYHVYCDPGTPPLIDSETDETGLDDPYKKGFMMVAVWSSLLDPNNSETIDISPNAIGNILDYPESESEFYDFYDFFTGDDGSIGYTTNPATGMPYETQMVSRGDYGRVLAEFWADGPDSETPPGHWFTILNYVNNHPDIVKKWNGQGDIIDDLEWDVKTYFALGGTMHDCAISAWGIKGWYDYVRPISAIRYMADRGQSSDASLPAYHPEGLPLIEGFSELIDLEDPLIGVSQENLNKVKIMAWRGPEYLDQIDESGELEEPVQDSTLAGVDWILAENWWPYQRPTFITPPFAGYVSGHSTFSRGAAELLADMTGDEYFPGGMGVFPCPQDGFLVFENGPSEYLELQWAKYVDASDQCSLSRIFGGIHPPADDIPGRIIGEKIGNQVFDVVNELMFSETPRIIANSISAELVNDEFTAASTDLVISVIYNQEMDQTSIPMLTFDQSTGGTLTETSGGWSDSETYSWTFISSDMDFTALDVGFSVTGAENLDAEAQDEFIVEQRFDIDTENPVLANASSLELINEDATGTFAEVVFTFNENMAGNPIISFPSDDPTVNSLTLNESGSEWISETEYLVEYLVQDADEELYNIEVAISGLTDSSGNNINESGVVTDLSLDTKAPESTQVNPEGLYLNQSYDESTFFLEVEFNDEMDPESTPDLIFSNEDPEGSMVFNESLSGWVSPSTYSFVYDALDLNVELEGIDLEVSGGSDDFSNDGGVADYDDAFSIDTRAPEVEFINDIDELITDENIGETRSYNIEFDEPMDVSVDPFNSFNPGISSLEQAVSSAWVPEFFYVFQYDVVDGEEEVENIQITTSGASDIAGNLMEEYIYESVLEIDTKNPCGLLTASSYDVVQGDGSFQIFVLFDSDEISEDSSPSISFPTEDPGSSLILNEDESGWFGSSYVFTFDVSGELDPLGFIDIQLDGVTDENGNPFCDIDLTDFFSIELDTFLRVENIEDLDVLIFPNPVESGELVKIELDKNDDYEISIFSQTGENIQAEYKLVNSGFELSTQSLASGVYYLKLKNPAGIKVYKLSVL